MALATEINVFCKRSSVSHIRNAKVISHEVSSKSEFSKCCATKPVFSGVWGFLGLGFLLLFCFVLFSFFFFPWALLFSFGLFSHYITLYFAVERKAFHWPLAYEKIWTVLAPDSVRNAEAHTLTQAITGFSPRELELIPSEWNSCLCAAFPTAKKTKYSKRLQRKQDKQLREQLLALELT